MTTSKKVGVPKLPKRLQSKLEACIQQYVDIFCWKHELEFDGWVANLSGTVGMFGDYFVDFETIRLDLETQQPKHNFFEWYDHSLEAGMNNQPMINYYTWIKLT